MATVTPRGGNKPWQATWFVMVDGKRSQRNKSFAKKADAKAFAERMADEQERRGIHDPKKYNVRGYLAHWLANHPKRARMSPTTMNGYKRHIDAVCRYIGDIPLTRLNAFDIDTMTNQMLSNGGKAKTRNPDGGRNSVPAHPTTVNNIYRMLRAALRQAVKWNLIPEAPTAKATAPTASKSPARAMSKDERARVMEAARRCRYPGMLCAISLLGLCGLRRSELLGLSWDDIDLENGRMLIHRTVVEGAARATVIRDVTKTSTSHRLIDLPEGLIALLRQHRAFIAAQVMAFGSDYSREPFFVFPDVGGHVMAPAAMTSKLRSLMRSAKVTGVQPVHGHRHTMASHMLKEGVGLKVVSARLGHSSTKITQDIYVHVLEDQDRQAAETLEKAFGGE